MKKVLRADWQMSKQTMCERGKHLFETGQWSDVKFKVGEESNQKVFEAHKLFLSMASPVFDTMFHGEMAEKSDIITINDIQPEVFKAMLLYVYTDKVDLKTFDQACELCYVAKKYMIPYLVKCCTDFLWIDISWENACRAYEFAKLFDEPELMEKCMMIIRNETKRILEDSRFPDVELKTLLDILDQEKLNIESELFLFKAVQKWVIAECERKDLQLDDEAVLHATALPAIHKIKFLTMKPSEFSAEPARSHLLSQSEAFAILMNLCSADSSYPMPEGFNTSKTDRTNNINHPSQADETNLNKSIDCLYLQPSYCERTVIQQIALYNLGNLERNIPFTVDKEIVILGMQVHSQIHIEPDVFKLPVSNAEPFLSHTFTSDFSRQNSQGSALPNEYKESLCAQLTDGDGSRLTFTHFQKNVQQSSLIDVYFNTPFKISNNRMYKVGVTLHKSGWYPMGKYVTHTNKCGAVTFTFCKTDLLDSCHDCFIRSIIFSTQ